MKISKISIKNYRSLRGVTIDAASFNVFVGQNNHGKTNLFEAIEWFYSGKGEMSEIRHVDAGSDEVEVEIEFSGVKEGIERITHQDNQTKLRNVLGDADTMRVRRASSAPKDRLLLHPSAGQWKKQPTGTDSAFNNCIPRFEFVEATKNLKDVSAYKKNTPIEQMLGAVIAEIIAKDPAYDAFHKAFDAFFQAHDSGVRRTLNDLSEKVRGHLAMQFPDCAQISFKIVEPSIEEFLKNYETRVNDGVETKAEDKGDGMQRALMLAIIKTHADFRREDALGREFIFFLDEAELHLHPTAQRQLKQALMELTTSVDQVFITTHSPVLIADDYSKQRIFRVEKVERDTEVYPVTGTGKHDVVYNLLGGNPSDLLLPANFLIVEGESEKDFLNGVILRFYPDNPPIQVLSARGDHDRIAANMEAVNLVFQPLYGNPVYRDKLVVMCDAPSDEKAESFRVFKARNPRMVKSGQFVELTVQQIESYYPDPWRTDDKLKPHQKRNLAKRVAKEIQQAQFEQEMSLVYQAVRTCWGNAYKVKPE
jgi:putative ATP-dependent endonuclease of OLD family